MTEHRQHLGREGEARAARFLAAQGYQIVDRNVRAGGVEIDLVVARGNLVAFVEVKSRRRGRRGDFGGHAGAAEAVDARKQHRLRRGAAAWLAAHPQAGTRRVRFDVITCIRDDRRGSPPPDGPMPAIPPIPPMPPMPGARNTTTAHPSDARWSIEHWEAAF